MTDDQIKDIADNLDCGFRCYIHSQTKSIKYIPDSDQHPDMETDAWDKDIKEIEKNFGDYVEIKGMDSRDSFNLMTDFVNTIDNESVKGRLEQALGGVKPFKNFKFQLDNSGTFRDQWFKFKTQKLLDWVDSQLKENGV